MRIKKKEHENLSKKNIQKVMNLLSGTTTEKAITKKEACDILNISYNTVRLQKIIDDFVDKEEYTKKRKQSLRGRTASQQEIQEACESYLQGDTISDISKRLFRSAGFVRSILELSLIHI